MVNSYSPIFEDHKTQGDGRNGSEQRLQCEGHLWRTALVEWLEDKDEQRRIAETQKDKNLHAKLQMGLGIVMDLAQSIHTGVLNSGTIRTEAGCENFCEPLRMENTSLLLSVPRKLEIYPGRTGAKREWMGVKAVRFHPAQRGTVPADEAAPAALGETSRAGSRSRAAAAKVGSEKLAATRI